MSLRVFPVLLTLGFAAISSADSYYLALGDSVAYGLQPDPNGLLGFNAPSDGDRGYVSMLADSLGAGGTRPTVVNLAIPLETSASFRDISNFARGANTNYGVDPFNPRPISQFDFAFEKVYVAQAAGHSVDTVSFALGANDVLSLLDASFLALTPAQQSVKLSAALLALRTSTDGILSDLRAVLPNATFVMPGYYNPYPAGSPLGALGAGAVGLLNADIQALATTYGGRYVDFYSPIVGQELLLTHIGDTTPDIHPNDAGYAALGAATVQAVPEPASMAALGLGALALMRRRRK